MRTYNFNCCQLPGSIAAISVFLLAFCARHTICCSTVQNSSACVDGTFLNIQGCCQQCNPCDSGNRMFTLHQCNKTHDAVCTCKLPEVYIPKIGCVVSCEECPNRHCVPSTARCDCGECYAEHDLYCEGAPSKCAPPIDNSLATSVGREISQSDETSFPAWGYGLVATGIVIGIILFASCFLCLGFVSRQRDAETQSSDNSESGLVIRGSFSSIGTESSFLSTGYPYLTSHSMLELLKNSSNTHLLTHTSTGHLVSADGPPRMSNGSGPPLSGSQRSSPVSIRDSPRPVRTIKLVKQSDKLSAVVL